MSRVTQKDKEVGKDNEILEEVVEVDKELRVEEETEKAYVPNVRILVSEEDEEDDDDEEDEYLQLTPWKHKGVTYWRDENTGNIYDYESRELVGLKIGWRLIMIAGGK